jgi:hypothetical protein
LIAIPDSFSAPRPGPFNPAYMKPLYDTGYAIGRAGIDWAKAPPGLGLAQKIESPSAEPAATRMAPTSARNATPPTATVPR